jgi:endonuclease/exonuclease/phosphatase family metal-dependent hydrolase
VAARLRVMTYNIRNGRGSDDRVDLARIAGVIASYAPDVVALQEVDAGRERSGGVEQAEQLAAALGMSATFAACIQTGSERYGIATLAGLGVLEVRQVTLPHRADHRRSEPRCALLTRFAWDGGDVVVVNTHLSVLRRERSTQVAALVAGVGESALILCGDFNCTRFSGTYRTLCCGMRSATRRARTWPARLPVIELDHILVRDSLAVVDARAWTGGAARHASDHLPVVAELERTTDRERHAA